MRSCAFASSIEQKRKSGVQSMEEDHAYSEGDWIVHANYGMGQIICIEVKGISGEEKSYYRIETSDSTYWMPVDQMESALLRPLSTPAEIQLAIDVLQEPPVEMSSNYKIRQNQILEARNLNTPEAIAVLIRDLRAYKRAKGILNSSESSSFQALKQQLAEEWAAVTGVKNERVALKLDILLDLPQYTIGAPAVTMTFQEAATL
jgi:RNA polymerase-interacting CarD/CdnL/TRCF family regulator